MDNPFKSPSILSICPGFLGLERGLERAIGGVNVVAYVEIEAFIIANLLAGMEARILDPAPIWTDIKTFDARPFRGKIHGLTAGYPCPGESLAGLREGHLYKGFIWPSLRRIIGHARPLWCWFENVDDHLTGTYPIVQRSLRNMGYAVEAGIFSAAEVGAPQDRRRLFILAVADTVCERLARGGIHRELDKAPRSKKATVWRRDGHDTIDRSRPLGNWPAPQGNFQWPFEETRQIESGMGGAAHGYNFRKDLLRAYGNSVVEHTAEIAFKTLYKKLLP